MASASWGKKVSLTSKVLHSPILALMRSATISLYPSAGFGVITLLDSDGGNHLAFHVSILLPFPIAHQAPSLMIFFAAIILLHIYDGFLPICASKNEVSEKYFAFITL